MKSWIHRLSGLTSLCMESTCPLCQRSTAQVLCLDCQKQVQRLQLSASEQAWRSPLPLFVWGSYSGSLKRALTTLKYDHQPQLAQPLGDWLAQSWLQSMGVQTPLIVVPIPMHADKQQQRGFNQAELLAKAFCQRTRFPLKSQALIRNRSTTAQFGLSATARDQNLSGAFTLGKDFTKRSPPASVLLLDDIYTTGATARSAARTLRQHQISVYGIVAIAKA